MKNKELNPLNDVVGVALRGHPRVIGCALFLIVLFATASAQVNVRLVTDEAEAVLNVLAKRRANQSIDEADWQRIFQSEGYVRLKKREKSMQRSFEDADFKTLLVTYNEAAAIYNRKSREPVALWSKTLVTALH